MHNTLSADKRRDSLKEMERKIPTIMESERTSGEGGIDLIW